ncbi:exported hypothetical protein [Vibrio crassostreae]|nr:exported hypothetical protein [Vibrio crassostreae]CAK4024971.1 exported hypothetical protein [Vibrio crassostreae]
MNMKAIKILVALATPTVLSACASVQDSPEYIELTSKYDVLAEKYDADVAKDKVDLIKQVKLLSEEKSSIEMTNEMLQAENTKLHATARETKKSLEETSEKLGKTQQAFGNYINQNSRLAIAELYTKGSGMFTEVQLSDVQTLKLEYSSKEVVFVKFSSGGYLHDGWYELSYMVNSYNLPKMTYGKSSFRGVTLLGKDGRELTLEECYECKSR